MATDKKPTNPNVKLKSTDFKKGGKPVERLFPIGQANNILSLKNAKWELADKNFVWNGKELAKA